MSHKINWHVLPAQPDTVYPPASAPPGSISILLPDDTYIDHTVCDAVNGEWVINPQKLADKQAREQAEANAAAQAAAEKAARRARLTGNMSSVNSVAELKVLIQDIVKELGL